MIVTEMQIFGFFIESRETIKNDLNLDIQLRYILY